MHHNGYDANLEDGTYSVSTFGDRISGQADNFLFLHKERSGNQRIEAYVESIEDRGAASQAGIMFRESTDPGSLNLMYTATAYEGVKLEYLFLYVGGEFPDRNCIYRLSRPLDTENIAGWINDCRSVNGI